MWWINTNLSQLQQHLLQSNRYLSRSILLQVLSSAPFSRHTSWISLRGTGDEEMTWSAWPNWSSASSPSLASRLVSRRWWRICSRCGPSKQYVLPSFCGTLFLFSQIWNVVILVSESCSCSVGGNCPFNFLLRSCSLADISTVVCASFSVFQFSFLVKSCSFV